MWKVLWWFVSYKKRGLASGVTFWNSIVRAMVFLPPCFCTSTICFYYFSLLLLVVLSAHSESPHHIKPLDSLDPTSVTVCPTSSSAQLGVLAPQNEVFKIVTVNCPLSNRVKTIIKFVLNLGAKSFKILASTLIHGGENFAWTIRILLESLQHVLKMFTWSLSENQASIQFRCRLIGLMLKQSLFRKYDLIFGCTDSIMTIRMCLWHLNFFCKV